jgi:malonate decarboxylase delta subunit
MVFKYTATKPVGSRAHVGVVGSGDLEVLLEPVKNNCAEVTVRTRFDGYRPIWQGLLDRFFAVHDIMANIEINDFGATPGVVTMRLLQALEVSNDESKR